MLALLNEVGHTYLMSTRHEKATMRAWRYGWVIYKGHAIFGDIGRWSVKVGGEVVLTDVTIGVALRAIDEVCEEA